MKQIVCIAVMLVMASLCDEGSGSLSLEMTRAQVDEMESVETGLTASAGIYQLKFSLGTPPVEILAAADTGSGFMWVQCKDTGARNVPAVFNPGKSKTYDKLLYDQPICKQAPGSSRGPEKVCKYTISYLDVRTTTGDVATDSMLLYSSKGPLTFKSTFGCGTNQFPSRSGGVGGGIVGLGSQPLSLISQLTKAKIERIFSYCVLSRGETRSTKMRFGKEAKISGKVTASIPMARMDPHYTLILVGVSYGGNELKPKQGGGEVIIDSGAGVTTLPDTLLHELTTSIKRRAAALGRTLSTDEQFKGRLCYERVDDFYDIIFRFSGGGSLPVKATDVFVAKGKAALCLGILPSSTARNFAVMGNTVLVNYEVEYNLEEKKISVGPFSDRCFR